MNDCEWDKTTATFSYKAIDLRFRIGMTGDFCAATVIDGNGALQSCDRPPGHTGRHMAVELFGRYPVAVWR